MSTGQAGRACLLNSACLWASGASPRHSASLRSGELRLGKPARVSARSSKRTVRLISGVALDECLDPERYRTRVPAFAIQPRPAGHLGSGTPCSMDQVPFGNSLRKRAVVSSRSIVPSATAKTNASHSGPSAFGSIAFKRRNTMQAPSAVRLLPSMKG